MQHWAGQSVAGKTDEPLRVIVVDDDPIARRAVAEALAGSGVVVVAQASGGREAVELAVHYEPDVVVMDLVMPDVDGVAATRQILQRAPHVKVVMLTASDDENVGLMTLRAGAAGFLGKRVGLDALSRALRGAQAGEAVVSRALTMRLLEGYRALREDGPGLRPVRSALTAREWEILDLLCRDRSPGDIANELVVSPETVRSHIKSILRKLGVRSRREAIAAAGQLRARSGLASAA